MNLYVWRHNRKFHSWSMFSEPCVHQSLYTDAIAIAVAETPEQALELLAASEEGWIIDELRRLPPKVFPTNTTAIVFADVRSE
jgi:hypothetical protein